jgi:hypothetical protein
MTLRKCALYTPKISPKWQNFAQSEANPTTLSYNTSVVQKFTAPEKHGAFL